MSNLLSSPSKWKKWLCWLRRGLPSATATGTRFSSRFSLWWSSRTWWLSVILRDILQVGQDVSCSSQDRRHELTEKQQYCGEFAAFFQDISMMSTSSSCSIFCTEHQQCTWAVQRQPVRYTGWAPGDFGTGFLYLPAEILQCSHFINKHADLPLKTLSQFCCSV